MLGELYAVLSALSYASVVVLVRKGQHRGRSTDTVNVTVVGNIILFGLLYGYRAATAALPALNLTAVVAFVVSGLLTALLGRFLLFAGVRRVGPARAVALKGCAPVFAYAAAALALGERLQATALVGALLMMAGVWAAAREQAATAVSELADGNGGAGGDAAGVSARRAGVLLSLGAACAYGLGYPARKVGLAAAADPVAGVLLGSVGSFAVLFAGAGLRGNPVTWLRRTVFSAPLVHWLASLAIGAGQFFSFTALQYTSATHVSLIVSAEPVLGLLVSALVLRREERLTPALVLAAALVVLGGAVLVLFR